MKLGHVGSKVGHKAKSPCLHSRGHIYGLMSDVNEVYCDEGTQVNDLWPSWPSCSYLEQGPPIAAGLELTLDKPVIYSQ